MAYNPYFTFSDPALQQAVAQEGIGMAQVEAQKALARQTSLERMARDREARAIRQAEIDRAERAQAQQDRQFQQSLGLRREELASNADLYKTYQSEARTAADMKEKNAIEIEKYNGLKSLYANPRNFDPPTPLEFEADTQGMSPDRKAILRSLLDSKRNEVLQFAVDAERARNKWEARIRGIDPKKGETLEKIMAEFDKSKDRDYLSYEPGVGFISRYKKPRQDVPFGPVEPPATGAASVMTPDEFRASLTGGIPPPFSAIQPFATQAITGLIEAITNPQIPPVTAATIAAPPVVAPQVTPMQSIQELLRRLRILPGGPPPPAPPPPPRMLGNEGVLAPLEY